MDSTTYRSVWYRWKPKKLWNLFAPQGVGTLRISRSYIYYSGRAHSVLIPISDINRISMGKQGADFINKWVKIEYGAGKVAYFADGRFLGWRGILGGTRRLLDRLTALRADR
ncbi:MAG TPA: hypothetical protein VGE04_10710 [Chloroflexia bacterium]